MFQDLQIKKKIHLEYTIFHLKNSKIIFKKEEKNLSKC